MRMPSSNALGRDVLGDTKFVVPYIRVPTIEELSKLATVQQSESSCIKSVHFEVVYDGAHGGHTFFDSRRNGLVREFVTKHLLRK